MWAIINVTPDSFWVGSRVSGEQNIISACRSALEDGADVLDIGGMSTRPGYVEISEDEEFERLDGALSVIRREFGDVQLSIDTYRSSIVGRLYVKYGKFIVNDVQGGVIDGEMYRTVAELGLDYVMMSSDGDMGSMVNFFERQIGLARQAGVGGEIIVDPGFGFGKTLEENFLILNGIGHLRRFGRVFVGLSRKSMICRTLGCDASGALLGTCALHWQALSCGADILRVHDVSAARDIIKLFSAASGQNGRCLRAPRSF